MEKFGSNREKMPTEKTEWWYEKVGGEWTQVPLPELPYGPFSTEVHAEQERRRRNLVQMMQDTAAHWHLNDSGVEHNEGILRDHPRYRELYIEWATRYLKMKGGYPNWSGEIDDMEGRLLDERGKPIGKWLNNEVAGAGREWVDEHCAMELRIQEGFVDITNDLERREELNLDPTYNGWWTHDET